MEMLIPYLSPIMMHLFGSTLCSFNTVSKIGRWGLPQMMSGRLSAASDTAATIVPVPTTQLHEDLMHNSINVIHKYFITVANKVHLLVLLHIYMRFMTQWLTTQWPMIQLM